MKGGVIGARAVLLTGVDEPAKPAILASPAAAAIVITAPPVIRTFRVRCRLPFAGCSVADSPIPCLLIVAEVFNPLFLSCMSFVFVNESLVGRYPRGYPASVTSWLLSLPLPWRATIR